MNTEEIETIVPVEDDSPFIRVTVIYNAFEPTDRTVAELDWQPNRTLAEYLDGLPPELDWLAVTPAGVMDKTQWGTYTPSEEDCIAVMLSPNKGAGMIIALVAMVALAIVAPMAGAAIGGALVGAAEGATFLGMGLSTVTAIATGVVMALGSALITAIMPKPSNKSNQLQDSSSSPSYSLAGARNTATEGLPIPYVYGQYRMAGNRVNFYTENSYNGLSQVAYIQYVIGEGEIDDVSDLLVNGQPLSNYTNVTWTWRNGGLIQYPINWFASTVQAYSVGSVVNNTTGVAYNTINEIDRFRIDISFPTGLYHVDQGSGANQNKSVQLAIAYAPVGTDDWKNMSNDDVWVAINPNDAGTPVCTALRVTVQVAGDNSAPTTPYNVTAKFYNYTGEISDTAVGWSNENAGLNGAGVGATGIIGSASGLISNRYTVDPSGATTFTPGIETRTFEIHNLQRAGYSINCDGGVVVGIEALVSNPLKFTAKERSHLSYSIYSPPLPSGRYKIKVLRTNAQATGNYDADQLTLDFVNEIQTEPVSYVGTATYAIRIQLTDQLNSEPTVTALVRGRKVDIYDKNGVVLVNQWSDNPADIALDMLLNWRSRYGIPKSRIDFVSFAKFRAHCAANGFTFNGVFDFQSTLWDCLMYVMRAGRANIVMSGIKWSVILDAPGDVSMSFTMNNIMKDSFSTFWLGSSNRYNQIEVQYYDKNDLYRRHSQFAIDYDALAAGEPMRSTSIDAVGIVDAQRAADEAQLQLNKNRYLKQGCSFDVGIEALGCALGDIIYVQHDMPQWGYAGTITSVSGSNVTIDTDIPFNNDNNWRMLFVQGTRQIATKTISYLSGNQVNFGSGTVTGVHRAIIAGMDYEAIDEVVVGGQLVVTFDRIVLNAGAGTSATFYKTDVLCEATIAAIPTSPTVYPLGGGTNPQDEFTLLTEDGEPLLSEEAVVTGTRLLTITGWVDNSTTPVVGDRVMIGQVSKMKKPFWITKIGYKTKHVRTLECIEYNETIYDGTGAVPTPNYSALSLFPQHVTNLRAAVVETQLQGGAMAYTATCSWRAPINDQRVYAGANVLVSVNYGPFNTVGNVPKGQSDFALPAEAGQLIRFKVVAYDITGVNADLNTAPIAAVEIGGSSRIPPAPANVTVTPGIRQVALRWDLPADDFIKSVEIWESATGNTFSGAYLQWVGSANYFVRTGARMGEVYNYWLRTVSITGSTSAFVGPYEASPTYALADDIGQAILDTSKFAQGITPVELMSTLPSIGNFEGRQVFITVPGQQVLWVFRNGQWTHMVDKVDVSIIEGQVSDAQIAGLAAAKITGQIKGTQITDDAIESRHILAGEVTAGKLAVASVQAVNIATGAVVAGKIAANAITAGTIAANTITANELAANSVVAGKIAVGAVRADQIAANQIKADHLAAEEIIALAVQIKDGLITNAKIANAEITNAKIANLTLQTGKIANGAISDVVTSTVVMGEMTETIYVPDSTKIIVIANVSNQASISVDCAIQFDPFGAPYDVVIGSIPIYSIPIPIGSEPPLVSSTLVAYGFVASEGWVRVKIYERNHIYSPNINAVILIAKK